MTPVSGSTWNGDFEFPEKPDLPESERIVDQNYVAPGWFQAIGTRILKGRDFDARDRVGTPAVALVNQAFVTRHFKGTDPIGRRFRFGREDPWATIVGVIADFRHYSLTEPMRPAVYLPFDEKRIYHLAAIIYSDVAQKPYLARLAINFDDRDVSAERESEVRRLEEIRRRKSRLHACGNLSRKVSRKSDLLNRDASRHALRRRAIACRSRRCRLG